MSARVPARGRLFFDLASDLATARLVKGMQGLAGSRLIDRAIALELIEMAKSVRLLVESYQLSLAVLVLGELQKVDVGSDAAKTAIDDLAARTRTAIVKG